MRGKYIAFAVALFSVATIGIVQLTTVAKDPGQVNNAPRCSATAIGDRSKAFNVNGNTATVKFKVTGKENCRVQLSNNSFYAPTMNGMPYAKQILFKRVTKTYSPGTYSLSVALPTQSTKAKGCFYQVDLTYGTHNVTPVVAYGHGKIKGCGEVKKAAACEGLTSEKLSRTKFKLTATASTANASVQSYKFMIYKGNTVVDTKTVATSKKSASYTYSQATAGNYSARVEVKTTAGVVKGNDCKATFKVTPLATPGIEITKLVENKKYSRVGVNVEYDYQISVKNTGSTTLKNAVVTDTPENGITLTTAKLGSIEGNTWTHTINSLASGETKYFTLSAKVPVYLAGKITNTVCVDAKEIDGDKDACDTADVDVPEPGMVEVCNPETGETISVKESEVDQYLAVNDKACDNTKVCDPETGATKTVKVTEADNYLPVDDQACQDTEEVVALPETGAGEVIAQILGAGSLTGAAAYYLTSRRSLN